jgi:predicted alpha/beta hydrolase
VAETAPDDVFIDDISFPANDGYLLGASLHLPRRAKRNAVLINSATAVPRKIYKGFASYLASRGCAVLTYDYRGIGEGPRLNCCVRDLSRRRLRSPPSRPLMPASPRSVISASSGVSIATRCGEVLRNGCRRDERDHIQPGWIRFSCHPAV